MEKIKLSKFHKIRTEIGNALEKLRYAVQVNQRHNTGIILDITDLHNDFKKIAIKTSSNIISIQPQINISSSNGWNQHNTEVSIPAIRMIVLLVEVIYVFQQRKTSLTKQIIEQDKNTCIHGRLLVTEKNCLLWRLANLLFQRLA